MKTETICKEVESVSASRLPQDLQDVFRRVAKEHLGLKTEKHGEE